MSVPDPLHHLVVGYPKIAGHMNIQPETTIFRRFGELNAKNLLYLQAELVLLEEELRKCEISDSCSQTGEKSNYSVSWYWLSRSGADGDTKQLQIILKIRKLLQKYNEAIIQYSTTLQLSEPAKWDLSDLQNFLAEPRMFRDGALALIEKDAHTWGSVLDRTSHSVDLVALRPRQQEDPFSGWISKNALVLLLRCGLARIKAPSRVHGVVGYNDGTIFKITYWISSILASLIPVLSIVVLYRVHSITNRLGIIAIFNILMSVCLSGFTNAKRSEVFTITTAFAAVQVVFVSTDRTMTCG